MREIKLLELSSRLQPSEQQIEDWKAENIAAGRKDGEYSPLPKGRKENSIDVFFMVVRMPENHNGRANYKEMRDVRSLLETLAEVAEVSPMPEKLLLEEHEWDQLQKRLTHPEVGFPANSLELLKVIDAVVDAEKVERGNLKIVE